MYYIELNKLKEKSITVAIAHVPSYFHYLLSVKIKKKGLIISFYTHFRPYLHPESTIRIQNIYHTIKNALFSYIL